MSQASCNLLSADADSLRDKGAEGSAYVPLQLCACTLTRMILEQKSLKSKNHALCAGSPIWGFGRDFK